ncbi:MAG TPA: mechanosensitive ion channel [Clostridia bacterium]|nr:mechanosensitive ion channel [Bacillota bacterium]HRS20880.1 mechanosensitive ion channel [Clostridia bacterium]
MIDYIKNWLVHNGMGEGLSLFLSNMITAIAIVLLSIVINLIVKKLFLKIVKAYAAKSPQKWDDILLKNKFFDQVVNIVPGFIIYGFAPVFPLYQDLIQRIASAYIVVVVLFVVHKLLNAVDDIYRSSQEDRTRPIKGFLQVIEIIAIIIGIILIISFLINRSPWIMLSGIGAATAIISLIFKDSILGFVAGIQLTANNMVKLGDWIEMPKYDANGDVIEITLHTVKVQNWNKSISMIPTYALISDSFKNWTGMQEFGGRRIKRHINIDLTSIKFCTEEMLERFIRIPHLQEFINGYNNEHINGMQLTNIDAFRAYLAGYLKNHPKLNKEMAQMVRQLQPTEFGLPIEIYVFLDGTKWVDYEAVQSEIFSHVIAVIPEFDLRVYQNPSGYDFRNLDICKS